MNRLIQTKNRNLKLMALALALIAVIYVGVIFHAYDFIAGLLMLGVGTVVTTDCDNIPDYICDPCGTGEPGRIRAIVLVLSGTVVVNPQLDATWIDLVGDGKAIVIPFVRGEYDGGKATTAEGFGAQDKRNTGRQHSLKYSHLESVQNVDFYDSINESRNFEIWYVTGTKVWKTGAIANFDAGMPVQPGLDTQVEVMVTATWSYKKNPKAFVRPPSVFDKCVADSGSFVPGTCDGVTPAFASNVDFGAMTVDTQPTYRDFTFPLTFVRVCCPDAIHPSFVDDALPLTRPTSLFGGQVSIISGDFATSSGNLVIRVLNTYTGNDPIFVRFEACAAGTLEFLPPFNDAPSGGFGFAWKPNAGTQTGAFHAGTSFDITIPITIDNNNLSSGTDATFDFAALSWPTGFTLQTASLANSGPGLISGNIVVRVDVNANPEYLEVDDLPISITTATGGTVNANLPLNGCVVDVILNGVRLGASVNGQIDLSSGGGGVGSTTFQLTPKCYVPETRAARRIDPSGFPSWPSTLQVDILGGASPFTVGTSPGFFSINVGSYQVQVSDTGGTSSGLYMLGIQIEDVYASGGSSIDQMVYIPVRVL